LHQIPRAAHSAVGIEADDLNRLLGAIGAVPPRAANDELFRVRYAGHDLHLVELAFFEGHAQFKVRHVIGSYPQIRFRVMDHSRGGFRETKKQP
jgi:hypothetical protein